MEFDYHYGRYKRRNNVVVQSNVLHSEKKQFRLSGEELERFEEHKTYSGIDESKFIRLLIKEALDKRDKELWEREVAEL